MWFNQATWTNLTHYMYHSNYNNLRQNGSDNLPSLTWLFLSLFHSFLGSVCENHLLNEQFCIVHKLRFLIGDISSPLEQSPQTLFLATETSSLCTVECHWITRTHFPLYNHEIKYLIKKVKGRRLMSYKASLTAHVYQPYTICNNVMIISY